MTGLLPELHQGRDGETQLYKLANQLRRQVPGPTKTLLSIGPLSLLGTGPTLIVPTNVTGWITTAAYVIPAIINGVQTGAPIVRIGSNATFDNVAPLVNLGLLLVVDTVVSVTLTAPVVAQANPIYFDVATAGTGPTDLLITVHLEGFFR